MSLSSTGGQCALHNNSDDLAECMLSFGLVLSPSADVTEAVLLGALAVS